MKWNKTAFSYARAHCTLQQLNDNGSILTVNHRVIIMIVMKVCIIFKYHVK